MARSATMPLPQNTTHPEAAPSASPMLDALSGQQYILRNAPDGDTAIRQLYAELLGERALLLSDNARLQLALQAATAPPEAPARLPKRGPLRPGILGLLVPEASMSRSAIETALNVGPLAEPLRDLVKAGRLTLVEGQYALPPDPTAAAPARKARTKGRPVRAA